MRRSKRTPLAGATARKASRARVDVGAGTGDEEDAGVAEPFHPAIVAIAFVEDHDRTLREGEAPRPGEVRHAALGEGDEGGQRTIVVEPDMQLHRGLAERVMRPGEDLERKLDERGVERVELVLETEAVPRRVGLAARVEAGEERLIERRGLLLVDPRQRRARDRTGAEMVEARRLRLEIGDDVAQAVAPRQLAGGQRDELREACHRAQRSPRVMRRGERVEIVSRDQS